MANELITHVKELGEVVQSNGNWLTNVQDSKGRIITPRNEAYARLQTIGEKDIGKSYGTRTSAGFEHAKEQFPLVRLRSQLLNKSLAEKAVAANNNGNYFSTQTTKEYEQSLEEAEEEMIPCQRLVKTEECEQPNHCGNIRQPFIPLVSAIFHQ